MTSRRLRVLFFGEAVTLSHVVRPWVLAASLPPERYDVTLASDPRFSALFDAPRFPVRPLASVSCEEFLDRLRIGSPVYDVATLQRYVDEDLALIAEERPDVVVGDFRLSLSASARLAGVPYFAITDACWSPFSPAHFPLGDHPMVRLLGVPLAQAVFGAVRPLALAYHCRPLNAARRKRGLPSLGSDLRHVYTDADAVLYADIPELAPLENLPSTHHYLGHVRWSPHVPKPAWWAAVPRERPAVYLSLGSSGNGALLPRLVQALAGLPVSVLVATAGARPPDPLPDNAFAAPYLPGDEAAARSSLVVCNGGTLTVQQALTAGVPVLGLASNMNQHLNMRAIVRAGAGEMLRSGTLRPAELREAVLRILGSPAHAQAAVTLGRVYRRYDAPARFAEVLARIPAPRVSSPVLAAASASSRVLEPAVKTPAESDAYDTFDGHFGDILFQGLAESALNMGIAGGRVLEIGTGTGRVAIRLARLAPGLTIDAVDHTAFNFAVARRNVRRNGLESRIRLFLARPGALPFRAGEFDLVIANNVLLGTARPLGVLRETLRVARPDGAILVRDVRRLPQPLRAVLGAVATRGYDRTLRRLARNSFDAALSLSELRALVKELEIPRARVARYFISHIGVEVPAAPFRPPGRRPPVSPTLFTRVAKSLFVSAPRGEA